VCVVGDVTLSYNRNPKDCWQQTKERCYLSNNNYSCPEVSYSKHDRPSPAISLRSLPELENVTINMDLGSTPEEKLEYVNKTLQDYKIFKKQH
jgi:hypothetical protein